MSGKLPELGRVRVRDRPSMGGRRRRRARGGRRRLILLPIAARCTSRSAKKSPSGKGAAIGSRRVLATLEPSSSQNRPDRDLGTFRRVGAPLRQDNRRITALNPWRPLVCFAGMPNVKFKKALARVGEDRTYLCSLEVNAVRGPDFVMLPNSRRVYAQPGGFNGGFEFQGNTISRVSVANFHSLNWLHETP